MKTYKPTYKDKQTGKKKTCKAWYVSFTDNHQIRRQLPAFPSKKATERAAAKIEELLSCQGVVDRDLQTWLAEIPGSMLKRLVSYGLVGKVSKNAGKTLRTHLEDYRDGLLATGRKAMYVKQVSQQIGTILDGCGFKSFIDIDGNAVLRFLGKRRGPDFGEGAFNIYLRSFKGFTAWLVRESRVAGDDAMKNTTGIHQTEFRKKRRALTIEEKGRFLEATESAPRRFHISGHERSLIYKLALQTGLRASEVKSLRKLSFHDNIVHVESCDAKGKRADDLVIPATTARAIQDFLKDKSPTDTAFGFPHLSNASVMVGKDLAEAGIPYTDDGGRDVDFHALRHTFITHLAMSGVLPSVCQEMARHSDVNITMKYYTHILRQSKVDAIAALENLTDTYPNQATTTTSIDVGGQKKVG